MKATQEMYDAAQAAYEEPGCDRAAIDAAVDAALALVPVVEVEKAALLVRAEAAEKHAAELEYELHLMQDADDAKHLARAQERLHEEKARADSYARVLRGLACWMGVGGYNAPDPIDSAEFDAKIRDGIKHESDEHAKLRSQRFESVAREHKAQADENERRWLHVSKRAEGLEAERNIAQAERDTARAELAESRGLCQDLQTSLGDAVGRLTDLADDICGLQPCGTANDAVKAISAEHFRARAELAALREGVERHLADYEGSLITGDVMLRRVRALLTEAPRAQAPAAGAFQVTEEEWSEAMPTGALSLLAPLNVILAKRPAQGQGVARVTRQTLAEVVRRAWFDDEATIGGWQDVSEDVHDDCFRIADAAAAALGVTLADAPVSVQRVTTLAEAVEALAAQLEKEADERARFDNGLSRALGPSDEKRQIASRVRSLLSLVSGPGDRLDTTTEEDRLIAAAMSQALEEDDGATGWASTADRALRAWEAGVEALRKARVTLDAPASVPASAPAADAATTERPAVGEVVSWERARADMEARPEARYRSDQLLPYCMRERLLMVLYPNSEPVISWKEFSQAASQDWTRLPDADADATPDAPPASDGLAERVARLEYVTEKVSGKSLYDSWVAQFAAKNAAGGGK